jgi:hypothetical protein
MIKASAVRDATLYVRISDENKKFISEKARLANMEEAPFVDEVLTQLRTTEEGQALIALDIDVEGKRKPKK